MSFDFDTATPSLAAGQSIPFDQATGAVTAHFSSPQGAVFSVQSDASTGWRMSQFSGLYIYTNNQNRNTLEIKFSSQLNAISFTFATADFQQVEVPTTVQLTAYLDSTTGTAVGSASAHGKYGSDTMPMGALSFNSGGKPFNLVQIAIPPAPLAAGGFFVDNIKVSPVSAGGVLASVSAASFTPNAPLAPGAIVAGFGSNLATVTAEAQSLPLPTSLGGVSVMIRDSTGKEQPAPLFFVSPAQINYMVPSDCAPGVAMATVVNQSAVLASGAVQIESVAPGLFSANANGRGVAAAGVVRAAAGVTQTWQSIYQCGQQLGSCTPTPVDLGSPTEDVILVLFGTGIRGTGAQPAVTATIGGITADVLFSGAQGTMVGLDQVNVRLPRALAGRGEVGVVLMVDGRQTNTVTVSVM